MTAEEKRKMMNEIMQVVDKHVAKSVNSSQAKKVPTNANKYGRKFGISDEAMVKWKEEYRMIRVNTREILEEVRSHPIDTSILNTPSIDIASEYLKFNEEVKNHHY